MGMQNLLTTFSCMAAVDSQTWLQCSGSSLRQAWHFLSPDFSLSQTHENYALVHCMGACFFVARMFLKTLPIPRPSTPMCHLIGMYKKYPPFLIKHQGTFWGALREFGPLRPRHTCSSLTDAYLPITRHCTRLVFFPTIPLQSWRATGPNPGSAFPQGDLKVSSCQLEGYFFGSYSGLTFFCKRKLKVTLRVS